MIYRKLGACALITVALVSCDRTRSSTGWDYMPDMYYSRAYESYTANPNFADDMSMRVPVQGTVPREMVPFEWTKSEEDRVAAGEALVHPLAATAENLQGGEAAYEVFCTSCHGPAGDGLGYLFTSKRYPYPPASLVSDKAKALKDGEIYHTITVGYGIMGAHGGMIDPVERWRIILYIRENLQK
jgi:mono/diheme cytochrome c family protein